jgi:hypothetical protein
MNLNRNTETINKLQDYMLTSNNLTSIINNFQPLVQKQEPVVQKQEPVVQKQEPVVQKQEPVVQKQEPVVQKQEPLVQKQEPPKIPIVKKHNIDVLYKPKQVDSLFWCFYILKYGYSNYEMDIYNKYFVVEKAEKFKYVELIRSKKEILKIHKIKPLTEIEDELANKERISVKTFFALCIMENINVLVVDNHKYFELLCTDIDLKHPINIIHRNSKTYEHHIELNNSNENIDKYRDTYYKMSSFETSLKSMGSYKLDELIDMCNKLAIKIVNGENGKKKSKKDIYELLVLNY